MRHLHTEPTFGATNHHTEFRVVSRATLFVTLRAPWRRGKFVSQCSSSRDAYCVIRYLISLLNISTMNRRTSFKVMLFILISMSHRITLIWCHWSTWASYQIRKIAGFACAGNAGNVPPPQLQRKPLVSDPSMHRGTCGTHVPWCMLGSLTHGGGENVPGIPGACATRNFTYLARGPMKIWCHAPAFVTHKSTWCRAYVA